MVAEVLRRDTGSVGQTFKVAWDAFVSLVILGFGALTCEQRAVTHDSRCYITKHLFKGDNYIDIERF